jgi:di- and tripeptidase
VLLSNSTWIDEEDPCVVFGMRGVLYANLTVSSKGDNAHSGVDGGAVEEPMFDMVRVLGAIADRQSVKLPGFCEIALSPSLRAQADKQMTRSDLKPLRRWKSSRTSRRLVDDRSKSS